VQIPELVGYPALVLNMSILVDVYLNRVTYWDDPKARTSLLETIDLVMLYAYHYIRTDRSAESGTPAAAHANPHHHADHFVLYVLWLRL
jgi:hypothetical protein